MDSRLRGNDVTKAMSLSEIWLPTKFGQVQSGESIVRQMHTLQHPVAVSGSGHSLIGFEPDVDSLRTNGAAHRIFPIPG